MLRTILRQLSCAASRLVKPNEVKLSDGHRERALPEAKSFRDARREHKTGSRPLQRFVRCSAGHALCALTCVGAEQYSRTQQPPSKRIQKLSRRPETSCRVAVARSQ